MSVVHHTAIVSGGNTGIGAAIARDLLAEGYDVISLSRRKPDWSHPKLSSREVDLLDAVATRQAADDRSRSCPPRRTAAVPAAPQARAKMRAR